jgi:ABC-type maltose transport system permease subunit
MSQWSNYGTPPIYLPKYPTLAFGVYEIDQGAAFLGANGEAKKYGAIMLSSIVPLVLFSLSQKMMIQNMSVGGLKG